MPSVINLIGGTGGPVPQDVRWHWREATFVYRRVSLSPGPIHHVLYCTLGSLGVQHTSNSSNDNVLFVPPVSLIRWRHL